MTQAVRRDEVELESLLYQAKEKALLQKDDPGQKVSLLKLETSVTHTHTHTHKLSTEQQ